MRQVQDLAKAFSFHNPCKMGSLGCRDFVELIKRISEGNGLHLLSDDDLCQLDRIPGGNEYLLQPHTEQLLGAGIAIIDERISCRKARKDDLSRPHIGNDGVYLQLRKHKLEVLIKPEYLSALGATILSWVLIPGPSNADIFRKILCAMRFENCLVNFVQGKEMPTVSNPIVMPAGWLYWLNLPDEFVRDHVEVFSLTASVAKPFSKRGPKDGTKTKNAKSKSSSEDSKEKRSKSKGASNDSLETTTSVKSKSASDDVLERSLTVDMELAVDASSSKSHDSKLKWKGALKGQAVTERRGRKVIGIGGSSKKKGKGGKSEAGVLLLDQNNRLIYMPNTKSVPKWEMTGVSASAEAFGSSLGAAYSRQRTEFHTEAQRLLFAGHVVPFYSLSHFMRFDFGGSVETDPVGRMRWLKSVLDRKAVFPKGTNQSFLIAMTGDSHRNTHVSIFPDSDCKITLNSLNHHKVYQDRENNPSSIYFRTQDDSGHYRASCKESKSGLLLISDVSGPEALDSESGLHQINKDLG